MLLQPRSPATAPLPPPAPAVATPAAPRPHPQREVTPRVTQALSARGDLARTGKVRSPVA